MLQFTEIPDDRFLGLFSSDDRLKHDWMIQAVLAPQAFTHPETRRQRDTTERIDADFVRALQIDEKWSEGAVRQRCKYANIRAPQGFCFVPASYRAWLCHMRSTPTVLPIRERPQL
jgi:hypothetical protein